MSGINILGGRVILPGKSDGEITHLHVSGERIAYVGKADPLGERVDADGLIATTVTPQAGHAFRITCDESSNSGSAPTGLACIAASIAFCYMTQFTRYIEHR